MVWEERGVVRPLRLEVGVEGEVVQRLLEVELLVQRDLPRSIN